MKGNQRDSITDGATGNASDPVYFDAFQAKAKEMAESARRRIESALNQPQMWQPPVNLLPSIERILPPAEPFMVLDCWLMTANGNRDTDWHLKNVRFLPSQVEQYYEGIIEKESTCLVLKSGNILLCACSIERFERALAQYREYCKIAIDPLTFKPDLNAAD